MYISTVFVLLQFVVLIYSFLWSLREGAKKEQVVLVEKKQAASRQKSREMEMMVNPMSFRRPKKAVVAPEASLKPAASLDTDDWATHLDENSGAYYHENRGSGRVVWAEPGEGGEEGEAKGDVEVEVELYVEPQAEELDEEEEEYWTTLTDERSGRRYSVSSRSGETVWIDPEVEEEQAEEPPKEPQEEEWVTHVDERSGRRYSVSSWTGETVWIDPEVVAEVVEEEEEDELATAKSRLRKMIKESSDCGADGTDTGISAAMKDLVSDSRGDWVEVLDADGNVLGMQLKGTTVYVGW